MPCTPAGCRWPEPARDSVQLMPDVLVASNRGPLSFAMGPDGSLHCKRGAGGLVAGLDTAGVAGQVRMLPLDAAVFTRAYNGVANSVLWFVHHLLFDVASRPEFDHSFARDWQDYHTYNAAFAEALAADAPAQARVLVQDYHLTLVPAMLRKLRPDLRIAHFSHTPWAPPDYYRMLPDEVGSEVLRGILGADHAGFLTQRWARAFLDCCSL